VSPNNRSVTLTALKGFNAQDGNTGAKSPNSFSIFVYYTGSYMQIGNSTNPGEWQTVAPPKTQVENYPGTLQQPEKKLRHMLDELSEIRISAQFVNFTFSYGPPIFSPYDPNNIRKFSANNLANTLNFVSGSLPAGSQTPSPSAGEIAGNSTTSLSTVPENIFNNAIRTFGSAEDYNTIVKPEDVKSEITEINSPVFIDARSSIKAEDFSYSTVASGTKFKLTFPKNAGGITFNSFKPVYCPEPNIKESYTFYNLKFENTSETISEILSGAVKSLTIQKKVDDTDNARIQSNLSIEFINLNKSENGLKVLQFMRQNVTTIRVSAGYEALYPFFEGMVGQISVTEGLSETIIKVSAEDLLQKLFVSDETMLVSTVYMKFPGMRYNKAINQMVYYSELHNHFKYALGNPNDKDGQSLAYAFNTNEFYRLPRVDVTMLNSLAASLQIAPYDDRTNTYYNLLKTIKNLSIQISDGRSSGKGNATRFDVPIYYWYTSGSGEDLAFQGTNEVVRGNGIVMSSRTMEKDQDLFYLSKRNISEAMITDVSSLHGMLFGDTAFTSVSESTNLYKRGIYRYIDTSNTPHKITVENDKELKTKKNLPFIENVESYIGYEKIILFDKPPSSFSEIQTPSNLIPANEYAQSWVNRVFNASFSDVYENIRLKALVTKPLKEWGNFFVAFETTKKNKEGEDIVNLVKMPDRYLYQGVTYNFDIDKNLITVDIDASKRAIQALE
jgi:hypothetical protein